MLPQPLGRGGWLRALCTKRSRCCGSDEAGILVGAGGRSAMGSAATQSLHEQRPQHDGTVVLAITAALELDRVRRVASVVPKTTRRVSHSGVLLTLFGPDQQAPVNRTSRSGEPEYPVSAQPALGSVAQAGSSPGARPGSGSPAEAGVRRALRRTARPTASASAARPATTATTVGTRLIPPVARN